MGAGLVINRGVGGPLYVMFQKNDSTLDFVSLGTMEGFDEAWVTRGEDASMREQIAWMIWDDV